jgi:hypothetical protein
LVIVIVGVIVVVIVRVTVVIVRIVAVGVVRIVIPWIKSPPEAIDKNEDVTVVEMCMPPIPAAVPVRIMTRKRVILDE